MPRQSRSRSSARPPSQTRGASTATLPSSYASPRTAPTPPAAANASTPKQPGMLAQMAATAGSVAVGSTIGHGVSSMLFGGRASEAPPADAAAVPQAQQNQTQWEGASCEGQAKEFTKCLDKADFQSCTWYLEQLKACQAAAAPY